MFIDDLTGTLTGTEAAQIKGLSSVLDVKILIASTGSRGELDARVGQMVNSANTLAIGVDPVHHYTFTHFGVGTGIAAADFQTVAHAGNAEFHMGHWAQGLESIIVTADASSSRMASKATIVQPTTVVHEAPPAWPIVLAAGGALFGVVALVAWMRRRDRARDAVLNDFRDEAQKMTARNLEEQGWHDRAKVAIQPNVAAIPPRTRTTQPPQVARPYVPPPASFQPAPVIVQSRDDGLLTGVLFGEALARPEREVIIERPEPPRYESSASSSWDSSPSFDSGSSGGGFDSGGGGFDGGSGGGDF